MVILLKTASVRVSSIQIMQVRVQNKGKSVWKSRYDGDVSPCDIIHDSPRVRMYKEREAELDRQDNLDTPEEERDVAKARSAFYQQQARRYQSREVRAKTYNVGELVLRLPDQKKNKLEPKWEGPFIIDQVLTGGAYQLRDASTSRLEPNPWNAARLQRFYA